MMYISLVWVIGSHTMSIKIKILTEVYRRPVYYKGIRLGFLGLPDFSSYNERAVCNSFYSLKKAGHLEVGKDGVLRITQGGEKHLRRAPVYHTIFKSPFTKDSVKNLLVIYDIPSEHTSERDWFRRQLRIYGFSMVQRSVWVGPSPLPPDFLAYVKEIGLKDTFKTFKLAKGYNDRTGNPDRK